MGFHPGIDGTTFPSLAVDNLTVNESLTFDNLATGDLLVDGGSLIIDVDDTQALLVRKDGDAHDLARFDTVNTKVYFTRDGFSPSSITSDIVEFRGAPVRAFPAAANATLYSSANRTYVSTNAGQDWSTSYYINDDAAALATNDTKNFHLGTNDTDGIVIDGTSQDVNIPNALTVESDLFVPDGSQAIFGDGNDYRLLYNAPNGELWLRSTDIDGGGTNGNVFQVSDGTGDIVIPNGGIAIGPNIANAEDRSFLIEKDSVDWIMRQEDGTNSIAFFTSSSGATDFTVYDQSGNEYFRAGDSQGYVRVYQDEFRLDDDVNHYFGTNRDYSMRYSSSGGEFVFGSSDIDGAGSDGRIFSIEDGKQLLNITKGIVVEKATSNERFVQIGDFHLYHDEFDGTTETADSMIVSTGGVGAGSTDRWLALGLSNGNLEMLGGDLVMNGGEIRNLSGTFDINSPGTLRLQNSGSNKLNIGGSTITAFEDVVFDGAKIIQDRATVSTDSNSDGSAVYSLDTSSNTVTLTLLSAEAVDGATIYVKRNGGNTVTIDTEGSETIDGSSSIDLTTDEEAVTLIYNSDTTTWEIY